jgi:hypothetical protein
MINIDLGKAKQITKDSIRKTRKPLLEAQDVEFQRALESGQDTAAIVQEKQRLRDLTKPVDDCTDTDALKALMDF